MAKRFPELKSFGSKAVSVLASGALALSLTPAVALGATGDLQTQATRLSTQHYEYTNDRGLAIGNQNGDYPEGAWVQTEEQEQAGTYIWKDYAHGDNAHYGTYSLYTELTVKDKVLTGINLRSDMDTFFGKWGMYSPHSNGWMVDGFLPDGVTLKVDRTTDADGNIVLSPVLSGADQYGYSVSGVYLESTDGTNLSQSYSQTQTSTNRRTGQTTTTTSETDKFAINTADNAADYGSWADGKLTILDKLADGSLNPTNLVNIVYKIGEYAPFSTYIMVDETDPDADKYLDSIVPTDYSDSAKVGGMGNTNRDRWTKTMLTETAQRWLIPWIKGETEELDTISGATKTSEPFDRALNNAAIAEYFTSVADDLKLTIDEGDGVEETQAFDRDTYTDQTRATVNESGQYVLAADFFKSESEGTHGITPNAIELYSIKDNGPTVTQKLQTAKPSYTATASTTDVSKAYDGADFSWNPDTGNLVVKNPEVTHVRIVYTLGHADSRHAYSLKDLVAATTLNAQAETASLSNASDAMFAVGTWNALQDDMKGFVGNKAYSFVKSALEQGVTDAQIAAAIPSSATVADEELVNAIAEAATLTTLSDETIAKLAAARDQIAASKDQIEASKVEIVINAIDANTPATVEAARSQYDALTPNQQKLVSADALAKLTSAEKAIADAHAIGSVAIVGSTTSLVYTGKAIEPAVTVKTASGSTVDPANYTVKYANNVNAGKNASVTVTGKNGFTGSKTVNFEIAQAANSVSVAKAKVTKTFKVNKKTKKLAKAQKVALPKMTAKFGTAKYSVSSKDKKGVLKLSGKNIVVKKGAAKGKYTISVKASVAKGANYKAATSKAVKVTVTVK